MVECPLHSLSIGRCLRVELFYGSPKSFHLLLPKGQARWDEPPLAYAGGKARALIVYLPDLTGMMVERTARRRAMQDWDGEAFEPWRRAH